MNRLTLRLPDSLHQTLSVQAKVEGMSLNQFIVYNLGRVIKNYSAYPVSTSDIKQQRKQFEAYLATVQPASSQEFDAILAEAEEVPTANKIPPTLKEAFNTLLP